MTLSFELQQQVDAREAVILNKIAAELAAQNIPQPQSQAATPVPELAPSIQAAQEHAKLGIPIALLPGRQKGATSIGWQDTATTALEEISRRAASNPTMTNYALVAKAEPGGFLFLDDDGGFRALFEAAGYTMLPTRKNQSCSGNFHYIYKHSEKSLQFQKEIGKSYISVLNPNGNELFSLRMNNAYVVGPGSQALNHSGVMGAYTVAYPGEIIAIPDDLLDFAIESYNRVEKKTATDDEQPIFEGSRNSSLASILGKARQNLKLSKEELYALGCSINSKRCQPPLSETEVRTIAYSVGGYAIAPPAPPVRIGGKEIGAVDHTQPTRPEQIEVPKLNKPNYPVFPDWVMHGTSIYEGFVKPVCDQNSRIPYFMFLPAAALMMNYLGTKVKVENRSLIPSFFLVLIGEKGRAIKSSSVEDAIEYLHIAGVMDHADSTTTAESTKNAGGKSLVWTVGSPEGLGLEMVRTNCRNAVLFYDELSGLISKTEIDSSSLKSSLLSLYESSKFSNTIKSRRENYSINPRTCCASLIACTTDENFDEQWSRLTGKSSGLDDRFMFLLQPKKLDDLKPQTYVNTVAGSVETKKRIDMAIQQGVYRFEDTTNLENKISTLGNRTEIRAEKWSLYFAVDLGHDTITEGDIERGLAVAEYEKAVKTYLGSPEAETKIAAAQIKYRRTLERKFDGRALVRDMERTMSSHRYGTEGWYRIYNGLKQAGIIAELGTGERGSPKEVIVRIPLDD